jgi:PAX-interacting protein 1
MFLLYVSLIFCFRTKPFDPFENNLFSGIVVCVSKLTANDCKTLWALVTYNGGIFRLTLDLNKTTHLIVTKPSGVSYHKSYHII